MTTLTSNGTNGHTHTSPSPPIATQCWCGRHLRHVGRHRSEKTRPRRSRRKVPPATALAIIDDVVASKMGSDLLTLVQDTLDLSFGNFLLVRTGKTKGVKEYRVDTRWASPSKNERRPQGAQPWYSQFTNAGATLMIALQAARDRLAHLRTVDQRNPKGALVTAATEEQQSASMFGIIATGLPDGAVSP